MPDPSLTSAVMQALADNRRVHADEIAVQDLDGDVVLRGTVGSMLQRAEAARTVRNVQGVHRVDDQLRVRPLGVDGRADADTEAAVLDALIADDELHPADVDVEVRDGAVTLRGMVELASQRDRAERIALGVPGVTAVHNRLRVWLTISADDIAERVTDAIGPAAVAGIDDIRVTVRDNDVTLTGMVSSDEHRATALAAAAAVPGVSDVHDELRLRAHSG
jgi:osmotically-inducible protein OsmY